MTSYLSGFRNHFSTEAIAGALPIGQNSPQKHPLGLYTEQLSGSAFTMARHMNLRSWLYRLRPSVLNTPFSLYAQPYWQIDKQPDRPINPTPLRWLPLPYPEKPTDFLDGLLAFAHQGSGQTQSGATALLYAINKNMTDKFFYNSDGELLIVPQEGRLLLKTELGLISLEPTEIAVIPRGVVFQVDVVDAQARGYVCENRGLPFELPHLGVIGANGLANSRDFLTPVAAYEDITGDFLLVTKYQGQCWKRSLTHSPLNVVAWHGNYAPYRYDLKQFNTLNTVSFDHPDPSIFTVLTAPSPVSGLANVDFVIFPPRWVVAEHTFRPPYFHRNVMSEWMGLIQGCYDAKEEGFLPGGVSLHTTMTAHGPDKRAFEKATQAKLAPTYYDQILAFMFESYCPWLPTTFAEHSPLIDKDYLACWQGF